MPQLYSNSLPFAPGRRALARARHDVHALDAADVPRARRPAADGGVEREVLDGNPSVQVVTIELACARIDHDGVHPFAVELRARLSLEGVNKQSVSALASKVVTGVLGIVRRLNAPQHDLQHEEGGSAELARRQRELTK